MVDFNFVVSTSVTNDLIDTHEKEPWKGWMGLPRDSAPPEHYTAYNSKTPFSLLGQKQTDVWMLGVIAMTMRLGHNPFYPEEYRHPKPVKKDFWQAIEQRVMDSGKLHSSIDSNPLLSAPLRRVLHGLLNGGDPRARENYLGKGQFTRDMRSWGRHLKRTRGWLGRVETSHARHLKESRHRKLLPAYPVWEWKGTDYIADPNNLKSFLCLGCRSSRKGKRRGRKGGEQVQQGQLKGWLMTSGQLGHSSRGGWNWSRHWKSHASTHVIALNKQEQG